MANTVSALSYANTFGDWLVTTNLLGNEVNAIGYGNWHKLTGTLYLDSTQLGLQLAGNTISYGYFQSLGSANSTYIQNNGVIGGQLYLQNTSSTLVSSGLISTPSISINGITFNGAITPAQVSSVSNTQIAGLITSSQIQPSPSFTGIPTSTTPGTGTANSMIATTGFVATAITNATGSLGTMSTQNAGAVNITGGTISGVTVSSIIGLGTLASQNANAATISGGTINGTTLGATNPSSATFTSLTANAATISGGTINGTTLGATNPSSATFTSLTANAIPTLGETTGVSATAATGTINYDVITQSVVYYTSNSSANWTLNIRGNGSTTLNSLMAIGETRTLTFISTQGSTGYYNNALTIDGASVTPKWQGGITPSSGNTSCADTYTYSIIKTANATFTVLASLTKFA